MELAVTDLATPVFPNRITFETNDVDSRSDEFTLDISGKIIDANLNPVGVTCYSKADVVGKSVSLFYDQSDRLNKMFSYDLQKAKKRDRLTTFGQRVGNNQRLFWARMDFVSFKTSDGRLMGFRLKIFDIENSLAGGPKTFDNPAFSKLPIPTRSGYVFVEFLSIIRCESDINYTIFHLLDGSKVIACRTMRQFEDVLIAANFLRIHKSDIINLKHIRSYSKVSGGRVVMDDNSELSISRTFKQSLIAKLNLDVFEKQTSNL